MADADAPPLYGDENEIACIEGVGNDTSQRVAVGSVPCMCAQGKVPTILGVTLPWAMTW